MTAAFSARFHFVLLLTLAVATLGFAGLARGTPTDEDPPPDLLAEFQLEEADPVDDIEPSSQPAASPTVGAPQAAPSAPRTSAAAVSAPPATKPPIKRFKAKALRIRRSATTIHYGQWVPVTSKRFEVWTPQARRLPRAEAMSLVGRGDLAERERTANLIGTWGWLVTLGATGALMMGGFAAGAAVGYTLYDPAVGQVESAVMIGSVGLMMGLFGILTMPAVWAATQFLSVDDDEALEAVQHYNRARAEEAGLDEAEIPFTFLGY